MGFESIEQHEYGTREWYELNGERHGVFTQTRLTEKIVTRFNRGKKHGTQFCFDKGILIFSCEYQHGKLDGEYMNYWKSPGQLIITPYYQGKRYGWEKIVDRLTGDVISEKFVYHNQ